MRRILRAPGKKSGDIALAVCEGESELRYLTLLRAHMGLSKDRLVLDQKTGLDPVRLVEHAIRRHKRDPFDIIFCAFDRDNPEKFDDAVSLCKQPPRHCKKLIAVTSVPCFEVWLLLHFEQTDRSFTNCHDVERVLKNPHIPSYKKGDETQLKPLIPYLGTAIRNAKWLESRSSQTNDNPSTKVHELVVKLEDLKKN
jgi:hypothetical protein